MSKRRQRELQLVLASRIVPLGEAWPASAPGNVDRVDRDRPCSGQLKAHRDVIQCRLWVEREREP